MNIFYSIIFVFAVIHSTAGKCANSVTGATWKFESGRDVFHPGINTVEECSALCGKHEECVGFTWRFDGVMGWCYEFAVLEGIHECSGCESRTVTEMLEGACSAGSEDIIDEFTVESSKECEQLCLDADGCRGFTWYEKSTAFPNFCFLYSKCEDELPCIDCSSGRLSCIATPQCYQYKIMDESNRNINVYHKSEDQTFCDNNKIVKNTTSPRWHGAGYYRFVEPAGIMIPETSPGSYYCYTWGTGWLNGRASSVLPGEEKSLEVCFDSSGDPCFYKANITVTRCLGENTDYYVYYLPYITWCPFRFCASMVP